MRVLVTGDRHWTDDGIVEKVLDDVLGRIKESGHEATMVVIEGGAKGADRCARRWAQKAKNAGLDVEHMPFPALWNKVSDGGVQYLDLAAGPVRNQKMLDEGKPDVVIAFHDDLEGRSKGTKDMIARAQAAGVKSIVVSHDKPYEGTLD